MSWAPAASVTGTVTWRTPVGGTLTVASGRPSTARWSVRGLLKEDVPNDRTNVRGGPPTIAVRLPRSAVIQRQRTAEPYSSTSSKDGPKVSFEVVSAVATGLSRTR